MGLAEEVLVPLEELRQFMAPAVEPEPDLDVVPSLELALSAPDHEQGEVHD